MKKLIMTIGLPRSGKSTWARKQGVPMVNPDSIRSALYGGFFKEDYEFGEEIWKTAKLMVKSLFIAGHDTVILDATNTTTELRKYWVDVLVNVFKRGNNCEIEYKEFNTSKEECIQRAKNNGPKYLVSIIEKMDKERS